MCNGPFIKKIKKTFLLMTLLLCLSSLALSGQEALKSSGESYYDFLSVRGLTTRPYLNYRTLSDSVWALGEGASHPWQGQNLGTKRQLFGDFSLRIYGPELFGSFNTAAPYGYNDGALWQGKGLNASLSGGVRAEGYGVELTFKPQLAFSQNLDFDILPSAYKNSYGYFWSYGFNQGIDAPQRFGDEPFAAFDWGDTEIRYTWKNLTAGFGTQAIWLGPAYLNPILHSNNAPTYPKLDIGLRKQPVTIPWVNWYAGDIEARLWLGRLSESDYFDNDASNGYTMFHGLSLAYAPSFLPGLTLFANRVCLVAWEWENLKYIIPNDDNTIEDQKASFGLSWVFPKAGLEIFGELGIDDFVPGKAVGYFRHPFHTAVYSGGLKKTIDISTKRSIFGEILFEFNWMEMSQDFQFDWPYSFYFHHNAIHGYTNRGQFLGSGLGSGGNSQYLAFAVYYPRGNSLLFVSRNNPDNNFIYRNAIYEIPIGDGSNLTEKSMLATKAHFLIGAETGYFFTPALYFSGGIVYDLIINPKYKRTDDLDPTLENNFSFNVNMKWQL